MSAAQQNARPNDQSSEDALAQIILPLSKAAVLQVYQEKARNAQARHTVQVEKLDQDLLSHMTAKMRQLSLLATQLFNLIITEEPIATEVSP